MPPGSPLSAAPYGQTLRRIWLSRLRSWQARLPHGARLGSAEALLEELQGALWLEMHAAGPLGDPVQALRRVLYREFETAWAHATLSFSDHANGTHGSEAAPEASTRALLATMPDALRPIAEAYLAGEGPEGVLRRSTERFGSRLLARLHHESLLRAVFGETPWVDLKRRAARLCSRVAVEGPLPAHRREARAIRRALGMLEQTDELRQVRGSLSGIAAARKAPSRAGNPESANACTAPRATARGR